MLQISRGGVEVPARVPAFFLHHSHKEHVIEIPVVSHHADRARVHDAKGVLRIVRQQGRAVCVQRPRLGNDRNHH